MLQLLAFNLRHFSSEEISVIRPQHPHLTEAAVSPVHTSPPVTHEYGAVLSEWEVCGTVLSKQAQNTTARHVEYFQRNLREERRNPALPGLS